MRIDFAAVSRVNLCLAKRLSIRLRLGFRCLLPILIAFYTPGTGWSGEGVTLSDAIRKTLAVNPDVLVELERVRQEEGRYRAEGGAFDWLLSGDVKREVSRGPNPDNDAIQSVNRESYAVGLIRQFRSGLTLTPSVLVQQADNVLSTGPVAFSSVQVNLHAPLLRNRGSASAAAGEQAARSHLQRAQSLRTQRIAERIATTAIAFYDCLTAQEQLRIVRESERLSSDALELVDRMITANLLDPADRLQAQAFVASRSTARRTREQVYYHSRLSLAAAIGYPGMTEGSLPVPVGQFPAPPDSQTLHLRPAEVYVQRALPRRGDYQAALNSVESTQILLRQADNARKMRLDFNLSAGYNGVNLSGTASGRFRSLYSNVLGPNLIAGLSLDIPVRNRTATGNWIIREAAAREAQYQSERQATLIGLEVMGAREDVRSAVDQAGISREGERIYLGALNHEQKKVITGESNLADLLQLQDRYTGIRLANVQALYDYTIAMIRFRLVTGSLLEPGEPLSPFEVNRLVSLPFSEQSER